MIETSLQTDGFGRSILLDAAGNIIAGNGVTEAAGNVGLEDVLIVQSDGTKVIAVQRTDVQPGSERAVRLAIADNRAQELSDFDPAVVAALADEVDLSDFWREDELDALLAGMATEDAATGDDPGAQVDRAGELQGKWSTKIGQIWQLGDHRIAVGDVTDAALLDELMQGRAVGAVFTDPPYGINYDPKWLDDVYRHRRALSSRDTMQNDDGSLDLSFLWEYPRRMTWGFPYIYDPLATGWLVWDKQPGVESRGIVTPIEMASTTMRKGFDMVRVMWGGYYRAAGEDSQPHPTQKPLGVYRPFIEAWTKPQELIFDPFCGSGPVMIVAEQTGRICYASDIEPKYAAVTLQRWADLTGREPSCVSGQ